MKARLQREYALSRAVQVITILMLTACSASQSRMMVQPELVVDELPAESTPVAAGPLVPSSNDISAEIQQARSRQHRYVVYGDTYETMEQSLGYVEVGVASWYGKKFHGRLTADGEVFDMYKLTAAHKTLPLPTMVRVTNLDNGKKVDVRVNDRGPFHDDRLIDLSYSAAVKLGFSGKGTAPVVIEALDLLNYPDRIVPDQSEQVTARLYLQIGAFKLAVSAGHLRDQVATLLVSQGLAVPVRVLQNEMDSLGINKVWIGPIQSATVESGISSILSELGLDKPIRVEIH